MMRSIALLLKGSFSEILTQDMSSSFLRPKAKFRIGRTVRSANLRPDYLVENRLNSCPDSDLRKI